MKTTAGVTVTLNDLLQILPLFCLSVVVIFFLVVFIGVATNISSIVILASAILVTSLVMISVPAVLAINPELLGLMKALSNLEIFLPLLWVPVVITYCSAFRQLADSWAKGFLLRDLKAIGFIEDKPKTVAWTRGRQSSNECRTLPRWFAWLAYASFHQYYNDRKSLPSAEKGTIDLDSWDSPKVGFQVHRLIKESHLVFKGEAAEERAALTPYLIASKDKEKIRYASENQLSLERLKMCEKLGLTEMKSFEGLPDEWVLRLT